MTVPCVRGRTAITGGATGSMDAIDGNRLNDGDITLTVDSSGIMRPYRVNATSGASESSPDTISPDTNAGDKRHILAGLGVASIRAGVGSTSPTIKFKKLTGTTANSEGGVVSIAHGLTSSKILAVNVIVTWTTDTGVSSGYTTDPGYQFNWYYDATNLYIINHSTSSENILSKGFRALFAYEP